MMESINIYRLHKGLDICLPTQIQDILSNENTIDLTDFDCPKQPLSRWNAIRQHLDAMMCSFNVIAMKRIITYSIPEFGISFRIRPVVLSSQHSILAMHPVCFQRNNKRLVQPPDLPGNSLSNGVWNARAVLCF